MSTSRAFVGNPKLVRVGHDGINDPRQPSGPATGRPESSEPLVDRLLHDQVGDAAILVFEKREEQTVVPLEGKGPDRIGRCIPKDDAPSSSKGSMRQPVWGSA